MLMGIATFLVSLVPTYESIGIWGAVILTFLRFVQGIGVGGEWGGSVLMSMEWARGDKHRGFIASWPQFGVPCGLFLANLAVLAFSQMSGEQFLAWGWRVPFFLSLILVAVGLYIRLGILETPIFRKLVAEQKIERTPMLTVIKQQPKEILLSALVRMAEQAPFYIFTAFVFSYGIGTLNVSRDFLLFAVLTASVVSFVSIPLFGHISDRIGRKKMYMMGAATVGVFGFIYFGMLNTGSLVLIFLAIVLSLIPHDMMYGPAGGADRRVVHGAPALQRRVARLSARLGHCRRPGAADRHLAVRPVRFGLRGRLLHPCLRRPDPGRDLHDDGLHGQGHRGRIRVAHPLHPCAGGGGCHVATEAARIRCSGSVLRISQTAGG